ncbi:hypothetical protein CDL12_05693 [Handroanthus impetiginosus]|uniref:Uncharacterized protein n=1 Tax=Handroanthus impetiginosus TaxID=429701 RepID=A0A2G9HVS4_9LAMI|nr:hypothetical protein CDL12_05693 [Handroanthus impetiginosus]
MFRYETLLLFPPLRSLGTIMISLFSHTKHKEFQCCLNMFVLLFDLKCQYYDHLQHFSIKLNLLVHLQKSYSRHLYREQHTWFNGKHFKFLYFFILIAFVLYRIDCA